MEYIACTSARLNGRGMRKVTSSCCEFVGARNAKQSQKLPSIECVPRRLVTRTGRAAEMTKNASGQVGRLGGAPRAVGEKYHCCTRYPYLKPPIVSLAVTRRQYILHKNPNVMFTNCKHPFLFIASPQTFSASALTPSRPNQLLGV
jgi:hypothetical protein